MPEFNPLTDHLFPVPQRIIRDSGAGSVASSTPVDQRVDPAACERAQGYRLTIKSKGSELIAHDAAGMFYGQQTLNQLRAGAPEHLPCLAIEDWPDIATRGYLLDVSRDRVPTMASLKALIGRLARLRINQLQLYTEHTIAYAGHEAVWQHASPLTFEQIGELEAYCTARFIDLVPCQNVFGHMERWLTKPAYAHLAEAPDGYDTPWGSRSELPCSLAPADPASFALSADLIAQLAAASPSALFNICCDETLDLGQGRSRELVEQEGAGEVYLNYLKRLCERVASHGKMPMFWGDIVLAHPNLIPRLPREAVLLNWNYEAEKSFDEESRRFAKAGVRFYVCGGTSSWSSLTGRGQNAVDNLRDAAEAATRYGAEGLLITDWGDHGHWQPPALSWLGLTFGGGVAWSRRSDVGPDKLADAISSVAADEPADEFGSILWQLSNVYRQSAVRPTNSTWWHRALQHPIGPMSESPFSKLEPADVADSLAALEAVGQRLAEYHPQSAEASLLKRELQWSSRLATWACTRVAERLVASGRTGFRDVLAARHAPAQAMEQLVDEHRDLWLLRSRPGGLDDSKQKLTRVLRSGS